MPRTLLTFGGQDFPPAFITSDELIGMNFNRRHIVNVTDTVSQFQISSQGNVSPLEWRFELRVSLDADAKFSQWFGILERRELRAFNLAGRVLNPHYLSDMSITDVDLLKNGRFLAYNMNLTFIEVRFPETS